MKQLFHIENKSAANIPLVLSIRLGEKHAGFAITDKTGENCYQLAYCSTEEWNENELDAFFSSYPVLLQSFDEVLVSYDYPQSVIIPSAGFKQDEAGSLLGLTHPAHAQAGVLSENIAGWQLYNVFSVPEEVKNWINRKFEGARYWQQYSLGIRQVQAANEMGCLQVDFRKEDFTVLILRQSKLLLAKAIEYTTPEDVVYYLLKACGQFSLSQQEVQLQLSGLIDKQSALYKELHQYFIHVEFRESAWPMQGEYPAHFFTSLNDLARCAL